MISFPHFMSTSKWKPQGRRKACQDNLRALLCTKFCKITILPLNRLSICETLRGKRSFYRVERTKFLSLCSCKTRRMLASNDCVSGKHLRENIRRRTKTKQVQRASSWMIKYRPSDDTVRTKDKSWTSVLCSASGKTKFEYRFFARIFWWLNNGSIP
jgi:hypothetical protein